MNDINLLRFIQSSGAKDLVSTLRTVEINAVDICNRSCDFCPQSKTYKSKSGFLDLNLINKIANDLKSICFDGRISFTGFGEPLLYKHLIDAITILKNTINTINYIEIVTNGDYLDAEKVFKLEKAGCTNITVSMYDGDMSEKFITIFQKSKIKLTLKHSYNGFKIIDRNNITFYNRNLNINRPCYLPFYKMMIDIDGNVLVCANDWGRKGIVGNIKNESINDIWLNNVLSNYRKNLLKGDRSKCIPCQYCDIDGAIHGKDSVIIFEKSNV